MQPSDQNDLQTKVDRRLRIIRTLWVAIFLSVGMYFVVILLTGQRVEISPNPTLSLALVAAGSLLVVISIPIKQKYLRQSVDGQRIELVQVGYIVALALCEVPALLGLLDHFVTGNRYYYALFIIAACGHLIHFPRRQHVLDACFKGSTF